MTLENFKLLYESQKTVIKLFNDYYLFVSEATYKTIHGTWNPRMLAIIGYSCSSRS